jgi:hypothetical protein
MESALAPERPFHNEALGNGREKAPPPPPSLSPSLELRRDDLARQETAKSRAGVQFRLTIHPVRQRMGEGGLVAPQLLAKAEGH